MEGCVRKGRLDSDSVLTILPEVGAPFYPGILGSGPSQIHSTPSSGLDTYTFWLSFDLTDTLPPLPASRSQDPFHHQQGLSTSSQCCLPK